MSLVYNEIHTWYIYNQFSFSFLGKIIGKDSDAYLSFSDEVINKCWNDFKSTRDFVYIDCDRCRSKRSLKVILETENTKHNGLTPVKSTSLSCNKCGYNRTIQPVNFSLEQIIPIREGNYFAFSARLKSLLNDVIK